MLESSPWPWLSDAPALVRVVIGCLGRRSTKDARRIEAHRLSHRLLCNLATWQPGRCHEPGHARDGPGLASCTLRCRASLLTRHQPVAVVIVPRTKRGSVPEVLLLSAVCTLGCPAKASRWQGAAGLAEPAASRAAGQQVGRLVLAVTVAVGSGSGRVRVVVARFPRCHLAISSSLRLAAARRTNCRAT